MRNIINKNTILTSLALVAMCFLGGINANAQPVSYTHLYPGPHTRADEPAYLGR